MLYNKQIFKQCFPYRSRYWYLNIKNIPLYLRRLAYLVKQGYDAQATWDTCDWFIQTMGSILQEYRNNHYGVPGDLSVEEWNNIIDRMIELLHLMDEDNPKYDAQEYWEDDGSKRLVEMHAAKDEFFQLFSEHFYALWD